MNWTAILALVLANILAWLEVRNARKRRTTAPAPPLQGTAMANTTSAQAETAPTFYGKDCPVGMVQVEFVGSRSERYSEYGWKPAESAFLEVWVDGRRFRIDVGTFHDGRAERRGIHIVTDIGMQCEQTAMNAASVFFGAAPDAH